MWKRIVEWFKQGKIETGNLTDFPDAEECDPNEPCRRVGAENYKGFKVKLPAFFEWWFGDKK